MIRRLPGLVLLAACTAAPLHAQQAPQPAATPPAGEDRAWIGDAAGRSLQGAAGINQAAGNGNTQANVAAIALGLQGGVGAASASASQQPLDDPDTLAVLAGRDANARIDGDAFGRSRGVLAINQVAGSGNAQLNLLVIGNDVDGGLSLSVTGMDDTTLAGVTGTQPTEGAEGPPRQRQAVIADGAFHDSRGVLQVNQTAGVGNLSTNAIVLQLGRTPQ